MMYPRTTVFRAILLTCLILLSFSFASAQASQVGDTIIDTLTIEDHDYTYTLQLPTEWAGGPLVVMLHPMASSGTAMRYITDMDAAAEAHGYAVVYPDSISQGWNDGRSDAGMSVIGGERDDVAYINTLVDTLIAEYDVDPDQVFLVGNGNGGTMAYHIACTTPERYAKVAVVGALMWQYQIDVCSQDTPAVDLLMLIGGQDVFYPSGGNQIPTNSGVQIITSLPETMTYWIDHNACDTSIIDIPFDSLVQYTGCENGTSVNVYGVPGGGNNWMRTGDYALNQTGLDATAVVMGYLADDDAWTAQPDNLLLDTSDMPRPRTYRVYVPQSYDPSEPTPFVFVLHGRPDNGNGIAYITGMSDVADENNFIVIYPDGFNFGWNYVRGSDYFNDVGDQDDTAFFRGLIEDLSVDFNLDRSRGYVTGFSNGGFMTHRLACEAPDLFAAFAPIAGSLYQGIEDVCNPSGVPVPILLMHGTEDESIPWNGTRVPGQLGGEIIVSASVPEYIAFWTRYNGCNPEDGGDYETLPNQETDDVTFTEFRRFADCNGRGMIDAYLIDGGGHTWPGRDVLSGLGTTSMDFNGSEVIWEFFTEHSLPVE